jgi:integrase
MVTTITDREMQANAMGENVWLAEDAPKGHGRFMARITRTGDRLFYFRYTGPEGKSVFLPIGGYDAKGKSGLTLKDARVKAGELSRLYVSGVKDLKGHIDAERQLLETQRATEQARLDAERLAANEETRLRSMRLTVNSLFTRWQELDLSRRKDKGAETTRVFNKDVLPVIGGMYAEEVKRAQVAALLDTVVARGARIVARNLLGDIRQMFGFAIRRGLVENDPTSHMKRDDYGEKVERERVMSEAEVRALPGLIANAGMFLPSEHAIWIMLATCCRVGELSQAAWADVDLEAKQWRIPAENAKNAKEHVIDLSDFAIRHFEAIKTVTGTKINDQGDEVPGEWVLAAKHNDGPVCVKSLAKQIGDRQRDTPPMKNRTPLIDTLKLPGGKWTPHDLRRTGATMMGALGVQSEVIERCLNHKEQNALKRIYQRHDYRSEMGAAWRLLGDRLDLLTRTDADNVLPFQRVA